MNVRTFELGLDRLKSSDWAYFEELCSSFLVSEFESLRTMAHPSGDGGRDSELFSPERSTFIACQYSVTTSWKSKIKQTVERIKEGFPDVRILIYLTNQIIGGQADELKKELLKNNLSLDVRDRAWFLERAESTAVNEAAAVRLTDIIARPYLEGEELIKKKSSPLSEDESKAALLYLGLQWQDDATDKGLTKLCFDALVRSALRHSHVEKRLSREEVHNAIHKALPSANKKEASKYINSALNRLTKRFIRHHTKEDEFCLTDDESSRIIQRLAEKELEESSFNHEVANHVSLYLEGIEHSSEDDKNDLVERIPRIIEKLLLKKGETFVSAVSKGTLNGVGTEHLTDLIINDLDSTRPCSNVISQYYPEIIRNVVIAVLNHPVESTQMYLRRLANSYTLFSFLNETPDVQSATKKLFSHGIIWLDTTVILPLIAEQLEPKVENRRQSILFAACKDAGIKLKVTTGIVEEINAHMKRAYACSQRAPSEWQGRTPFLYKEYIQTGRPPSEFGKWLSLFRGRVRPEDDIVMFLSIELGIEKEDLSELAASDAIDDNLKWAAERLWTEAHQERRQNSFSVDDSITQHLIQNDLDVYLGVIALRKKEDVTELGYKHWVLTFDRIAWGIRDQLREELIDSTPPSPLMSHAFLVNNLMFGPNRKHISKAEEMDLPVFLDVELSESTPYNLLKIAEDVRTKNAGLPGYVIQRNVRDAMDAARHRCWAGSVRDLENDEELETECDPDKQG